MVNNIKLEPVAYLQIFKHVKMNHMQTEKSAQSEDPLEEYPLMYGLLIGYVEENTVIVTEYVPLFRSPQPVDFEIKHPIFHVVEETNEELYDPNYLSDQVVGWVRSALDEDVICTGLDIKNHLYIQTAYNSQGVCLLLPASGDQYLMEFRTFKDRLCELDESSQLTEIDWDFKNVEDIDRLFELVPQIYAARRGSKPLTEEYLAEEGSK